MKEHLKYLITAAISVASMSQGTAQSFEFLDINNVKARIDVSNYLFSDPINSTAGYEYPKGSGKKTLSSLNLMLLGTDVNGQFKGLGGPRINNNSLYGGPIMNPSEYATEGKNWDRVWKVDCSTIETFKKWYQAGVDDAASNSTSQTDNFPGYTIPQVILDWPAHGDMSKGQAWKIAPFFDTNGDDFYDPNSGDYPLIKGDQAIFFVYNDERSASSLVPRNRTEVRVMAYAFESVTSSALDNTIFLSYEIFNRSTFFLLDTYIGFDADFDIGGSSDDYIGTDVQRASFYGYNGDNFDESVNGSPGYGNNLAAQSVVILNGPYRDNDGVDNPITKDVQDAIDANGYVYDYCGLGYSDAIIDNERLSLENFIDYNGSGVQGTPLSALDYYYYSRGLWKDGSSLFYGGNGHSSSGGGTVSSKFAYPGNSDPLSWGTKGVITSSSNWSEANAGNLPGDRNGIGTMGPFTWGPGEVEHIEIALVSAIDYTGIGNQAPITIMNERIDSIKSYYCNGLISQCSAGDMTTSIKSEKSEMENIVIAPNPFKSNITVSYKSFSNSAVLSVHNLIGEEIMSQNITQEKTSVDLSNQPGGIYFVAIIDGDKNINRKVIKQ